MEKPILALFIVPMLAVVLMGAFASYPNHYITTYTVYQEKVTETGAEKPVVEIVGKPYDNLYRLSKVLPLLDTTGMHCSTVRLASGIHPDRSQNVRGFYQECKPAQDFKQPYRHALGTTRYG